MARAAVPIRPPDHGVQPGILELPQLAPKRVQD